MIDRDRTGEQFGEYRLIRKLGQGSFGEVYLGEHIHLQTNAAIKLLLARVSVEEQQQFLEEARKVARLDHPHIVRVLNYAVQQEQGVPFLVMQYASGGSLGQRHPGNMPLPIETILPYIQQVAEALQHAHDQRVIHLDVKPANMLLDARGNVLLADFGIALALQHTRTHQTIQGIAGTAAYAAPEQLASKPGWASDQYALAITAYHWLTGTFPFQGSDPVAVGAQKLLYPPPPLRLHVPTLSPAVEAVVLRGLAVDPAARFPSVRAFAEALTQAQQHTRQMLNNGGSPGFSLPPTVPAGASPPSALPPTLPVAPNASRFVPYEASHSFSTNGPSPLLSQPLGGTESSGPFGSSSVPLAPPLFEELYALRHSGRYVAWNPTTPMLASADEETIKLWDAQTGQLIRSLKNLQIVGLAWSSDGQVLMIISSLEVTLWSLQTVQEIRRVKPPGNTLIERFAFHPNGQALASTGADHHQVPIVLWNTQKGKLSSLPSLRRTLPESKGMASLAWNPSGTILAGGAEHHIHLWDTQKEKLLRTLNDLNGHTRKIHSLSWSPDGQTLASGSEDHTIKLWNVQTGQLLRTLTNQPRIYVKTVVWNPARPLLASQGLYGTITFWDAQTGRLLSTPNGQHDGLGLIDSQRLSWSPDGQLLAQAGKDVKIWRVR